MAARRPRRPKPATATCPHCGASFRAGRPACPECGSDAETGWKDAEEIDYQSVELPDPDPAPAATPSARGPWIVTVVLIAALIAWLVLGGLL